MFYYKINKEISNIYDCNNLKIIGFVEIYSDEEKTNKLTELSFNELNLYLQFSDCPQTSKEDFDVFVEDKVLEKINNESIQNKLEEIKKAKELGLI